jgi:hypothetical protein
MIKITEKNRSLIFLAGTVIMGILIIFTLVFLESNDVEGVEMVTGEANTNYKQLEQKIEDLKNQNFNPTSYNTLATAIDASYQQDLITGSAKTNLVSKLTTVYSDLIHNQCESFLSGSNSNGQEVLNWLSHLEKISSRNSKITYYKDQIKWYNYYATSLPSKVSSFIAPGITNYDETIYQKLSNEVNTMPNLQEKYRNKSKFKSIKTNLISRLQTFNTQFYISDKI